MAGGAKTASKNNPDTRGEATKPRKYNSKIVKPVLYIFGKNRFMAAAYENGDLAINPQTKLPVAYANCEKQ
jgi:hypothetical protein